MLGFWDFQWLLGANISLLEQQKWILIFHIFQVRAVVARRSMAGAI